MSGALIASRPAAPSDDRWRPARRNDDAVIGGSSRRCPSHRRLAYIRPSRLIVSRSPRLHNCSPPMQPTFGPPANTELSLIERTLLRQANLRASERCAVADVDLKTHLAELSSVSRDG